MLICPVRDLLDIGKLRVHFLHGGQSFPQASDDFGDNVPADIPPGEFLNVHPEGFRHLVQLVGFFPDFGKLRFFFFKPGTQTVNVTHKSLAGAVQILKFSLRLSCFFFDFVECPFRVLCFENFNLTNKVCVFPAKGNYLIFSFLLCRRLTLCLLFSFGSVLLVLFPIESGHLQLELVLFFGGFPLGFQFFLPLCFSFSGVFLVPLPILLKDIAFQLDKIIRLLLRDLVKLFVVFDFGLGDVSLRVFDGLERGKRRLLIFSGFLDKVSGRFVHGCCGPHKRSVFFVQPSRLCSNVPKTRSHLLHRLSAAAVNGDFDVSYIFGNVSLYRGNSLVYFGVIRLEYQFDNCHFVLPPRFRQ